MSRIGRMHITVPAGVERMGYNVFNQCPGDLVVYCEAESKPEGWDDEWYLTIDPDTIEWGYVPPSE